MAFQFAAIRAPADGTVACGPIVDARARVGRIQIADTHCAGGAGRATDAGASPLVRTIMREAR